MPKPLNHQLPESKVDADPKLEKRSRRKHPLGYKLKIIAEAKQREIEKLQATVAQLTRELEITQGCVSLQKKALAMLDLQSSGKKP